MVGMFLQFVTREVTLPAMVNRYSTLAGTFYAK